MLEKLFFSTAVAGLAVVLVAGPIHAAPYESADDILEIRLEGHIALLASRKAGLEIVDLSDPQRARRIGHVPIAAHAVDLAIVGSRVAVAAREDGLVLVDWATPSGPTVLSRTPLPAPVIAVAASGDRLYAVGEDAGVWAFETRYDGSIRPLGMLPLARTGRAIAVGPDAIVFMSDGLDTVEILDFSDPSVPARIGQMGFSGYAYDLVVDRGRLLVTDAKGVQILGIDDPKRPVLRDLIPSYSALRVAVVGDLLTLADGYLGLGVYESTPDNPIGRVAQLPTGFAQSVQANANMIVVGSRGRLSVVDLRESPHAN